MKKLLLMVCLALAACGGGNDAGLDWHEITAKQSAKLTTENDSPACEVNIQVEECTSDNIGKVINQQTAERLFGMKGLQLKQAADSFARHYVRLYQEDMRPFYRDDRNVKERKKWYDYRYNIKMTHVSRRTNTVSTIIDLERYEGGAHSVENRIVMNFDTESGKQITLPQLLIEGYETLLCEQLTDELMKKTGAKSTDELREKGYLNGSDMIVPDNYILGDEEITFVFNPYEIASYDKGFTEIKIEKNKLWKE